VEKITNCNSKTYLEEFFCFST